MRKLLVSLLSLSLLAGLFLAGAMPVMAMPMAESTVEVAASSLAADCPGHASQPKPMDEKRSGHADISCCISGHCPMLSPALMPSSEFAQPFHMGSLVRPVVVSLHRGVVDSPHLRPPRHTL